MRPNLESLERTRAGYVACQFDSPGPPASLSWAFFRDVLGWNYVAADFDKDWLIFKSGPSEMGAHPTHSEWKGQTYDHPRHHLIALMCDDIDATVAELRAKGAQFRGPSSNASTVASS
jgi:hypothetical protein